MVQIAEMTHKQKVKMYKKLKKKELIEMLIAANKVIETMPVGVIYNPQPSIAPHPYKGWEITCSCTEPTPEQWRELLYR
jgi:hypothetical protein